MPLRCPRSLRKPIGVSRSANRHDKSGVAMCQRMRPGSLFAHSDFSAGVGLTSLLLTSGNSQSPAGSRRPRPPRLGLSASLGRFAGTVIQDRLSKDEDYDGISRQALFKKLKKIGYAARCTALTLVISEGLTT